jgi:peptide/nickel transport system substrate-binding protein
LKIRRLAAVAAVVAVGGLILSGCAAPQAEIVEGSSLSVAWNQAFFAYNNFTSDGNATANGNITYMTTSTFNYYDNTPKLLKNTDFGTYTVLSKDPLTVKYTIKDGVKWSDGTPVDAADMLLAWAANISKFNNVKPETDADGNVTNEDAIKAGVFFDSVELGTSTELVKATPKISDNNKSLTLVYSEPYVDWEVNFTVGVPAHSTYELAFPKEKITAEAAKAKVVKAIQKGDTKILGPLSLAWSHGYDFVDQPTNKQQYLSDGAYVIDKLVKDQYITLKVNPAYTWGPKPKYAKITIRFIPDPLAQVQALQNGEVSIINPQSTADTLTALQAIPNATIKSTSDATYEHWDLVFNNGGPFDPKTYGGDEAKAKAVRLAFLKTLPRQEVIDKLIKPLNPDAKLENSQTLLPGYAGYDDIVAKNGSADYATVDIDGAKKLLADAGVSTPIDVKWLYGKSNTRRQNEYQLVAASAALAGFNVIDDGDDNWTSILGDGSYDASDYGSQSTSTAITAGDAQFTTGAGDNLIGYSNAKVDADYKKLAGTFKAADQQALLLDVEKNLWADGFGVTVFQFPGITAYTNDVTGVSPAPLAPQFFWNFWEWAPAKK